MRIAITFFLTDTRPSNLSAADKKAVEDAEEIAAVIGD